MRLTPALEDSSLIILKTPISPVFLTCGPSQNSLEYDLVRSGSPIEYTLTSSGYFSLKNALAPNFKASSLGIFCAVTGKFNFINPGIYLYQKVDFGIRGKLKLRFRKDCSTE